MLKKNEIQRKITRFCQKIEQELEQEKILDQLAQKGQTWNVIEISGEMLVRGVLASANQMDGILEDQRLFY